MPPNAPVQGRFAIARATRDEARLVFRLLQLYYFDASRWSGEDVGADGLYESDEEGVLSYLDPTGPDAAYLLRVDGQPAGVALVESYLFEGRQIREFADLFVLPKYRRLGLAEAATRQIVLGQPGPWLFAVFRKDEEALRHWRKAFERLPFRSVRPGEHDEQFHLFFVNED